MRGFLQFLLAGAAAASIVTPAAAEESVVATIAADAGPAAVDGTAGVPPTGIATAEAVEELAFGAAPVSDGDLAQARGGFLLPGGIDVSIAVQSDTRVNGVLLLRTIFVADTGPATLNVFGRTGEAAETRSAGADAGAAGAAGSSSTSVSVGNTARIEVGEDQDGLSRLDVSSGGVAAAGGIVRVERVGAGSQVVLNQATLDVRHLVGQSYGTIAANRGNDVAIDTATIINLDLQNVTPLNVGSALFRAGALGMDAAAALGGR